MKLLAPILAAVLVFVFQIPLAYAKCNRGLHSERIACLSGIVGQQDQQLTALEKKLEQLQKKLDKVETALGKKVDGSDLKNVVRLRETNFLLQSQQNGDICMRMDNAGSRNVEGRGCGGSPGVANYTFKAIPAGGS